MSQPEESDTTEAPRKKSKLPLILGLAGMLIGGGGAGAAVWLDLVKVPFLPGHADEHAGTDERGDGAGGEPHGERHASAAHMPATPLPAGDFIAVPEMIVPLHDKADARHLRALIHIEAAPGEGPQIEAVMPRIQDVLNTYLRALEEVDLERPGGIQKIRAQMLRRVRLAAGEQRVRDVLISDFILL